MNSMKTVLIFPGYGSQYVGMAKDLYDEHRLVQEYFEEASNCVGENFVKLCFASSEAELAGITNAYLSLFLVCCAIFDLISKETSCVPDAVTGFNQGEYAALFAAGGMSFPDGLYLLKKYALLYETLLEDINARVITVSDIDLAVMEDICVRATTSSESGSEKAFIAIYYKPNEFVISGHSPALDRVRDFVSDAGGTVTEIGLGVGLHSPVMDMVYHGFRPYIEKVDCKTLNTPLVSEVFGSELIVGCQEVKELVSNHINAPVRWTAVTARLAEYDTIIQVGPGNALCDMLRKQYPDKRILTVHNSAGLNELKLLYPLLEESKQLEQL